MKHFASILSLLFVVANSCPAVAQTNAHNNLTELWALDKALNAEIRDLDRGFNGFGGMESSVATALEDGGVRWSRDYAGSWADRLAWKWTLDPDSAMKYLVLHADNLRSTLNALHGRENGVSDHQLAYFQNGVSELRERITQISAVYTGCIFPAYVAAGLAWDEYASRSDEYWATQDEQARRAIKELRDRAYEQGEHHLLDAKACETERLLPLLQEPVFAKLELECCFDASEFAALINATASLDEILADLINLNTGLPAAARAALDEISSELFREEDLSEFDREEVLPWWRVVAHAIALEEVGYGNFIDIAEQQLVRFRGKLAVAGDSASCSEKDQEFNILVVEYFAIHGILERIVPGSHAIIAEVGGANGAALTPGRDPAEVSQALLDKMPNLAQLRQMLELEGIAERLEQLGASLGDLPSKPLTCEGDFAVTTPAPPLVRPVDEVECVVQASIENTQQAETLTQRHQQAEQQLEEATRKLAALTDAARLLGSEISSVEDPFNLSRSRLETDDELMASTLSALPSDLAREIVAAVISKRGGWDGDWELNDLPDELAARVLPFFQRQLEAEAIEAQAILDRKKAEFARMQAEAEVLRISVASLTSQIQTLEVEIDRAVSLAQKQADVCDTPSPTLPEVETADQSEEPQENDAFVPNGEAFLPQPATPSGPTDPHMQPSGFEELRKLGLEDNSDIEADGHTIWTDLNRGDPGVSILEFLAVSLADLGLRINVLVGDILAEPESN